MRIAADRLAAIAVIGEQLGLVADADLAHFDTGTIFASQVLDQFAKIDAFLGQKIEDDAFTAEEVLDVHQLHLQVALLDELAATGELGDLLLVDLEGQLVVRDRHGADDLSTGRLAEQCHRPRRRLAQHVAGFLTAVRQQNYGVVALAVGFRARLELAEEAHHTVANNVGGHRGILAVRSKRPL